uniref:Uncharacterized protein n=1 Tax=Branchiostoma floridae TaxID=7739 RepID=C3ZKR3_BRAFL|eukprot:XP_002590901.1 hypothetical protein BRAFLDRAFT_250581 [Branchiostoma floridae]
MESLERDLSCPVCLEMFNKPVLLLPCQHNLCRHCAEDILTNMGGWARYGGSFKCPTCRDQITLGRQGLDGLKRNILVETIIESYRVAQSAGIKTAPPGGGAYCRDHKDERVNLYCVTDERPICGLCVIGQHNQHNIIELQTIFKEKKEKIETEMNRLQQKNSDMSKEMSDIQATLRIIEVSLLNTKAKLLSECESLITLINERKDALVEKLEKEQRESSRTLREQIASRQTRLDKSKKTAAWVEDMLGKKDVAQFIQVRSSALDRADRATTSSPADDDFGSALRARRTAAASALERIERTTAALLDDASDYRSPSSYRTTSALDRANSALERGSSALERTSALLEGRRAERTERASAILGTERDRDRDRDRNESLSTSSRHDDIDTSAMSLLSRKIGLTGSFVDNSWPGLLFRLDPKTAHRDLKLTNGNLTVEWDPDYDIDVEDSVERFLGYSVAVLGDKAISSGRHYWEIDVSESRTYRIGVCSRDAQRDSIIGNTEDGWVLRRNAREYTLRHDVNSPVRLAMQHDLDKIGILLDYNRGELAFYNADIGLRLHTLKAHFVSPICPAFSLWDGVVTVVSGCPWPDFLLN